MTLWRRIFAERRSILVPLVLLLVIDAALLGAVVLPLKRVVAGEVEAADAARFATALARQRLIQMQAARASRDRAEQELAKFYGQVLPKTQAEAGRIALLEVAGLAKDNELALGNRSFQEETVKDSPLQRLTMKVELVGEYSAIRRFLYDVETSEAFLVISSVSLAQATRQQQSTGLLQLALEMATYYQGSGAK